jgi:hypothetical protein
MSSEAPQNQHPEPNPATRAEVHAAFTEVQSSLYKMSADPAFQAKCLKQGIDPIRDGDTTAYWTTFADHAYGTVTKLREKNGESLRVTAFELITATPAYVHSQHRLHSITTSEQAGKQLSQTEKDEKHRLKTTASYFNGIIRDFAVHYPNASPDNLSLTLVNVIGKTIDDPKMREFGETVINTGIRGAQHELALGQILSQTGRHFETTTTADDLKGVDYRLTLGDGRTLDIDAKASLYTQRQSGNLNRAYSWGESGQLILFSLVRDSEFHDRFFIDDSLAAERAPGLNRIIDEATGGAQSQAQ